MNWIDFNSSAQLEEILETSRQKAVLIFKHSTRCSISSMAKNRLERKWDKVLGEKEIFYLDVLEHRSVSDLVANSLEVKHESPQAIIVKNGQCVLNMSHNFIDFDAILPYFES